MNYWNIQSNFSLDVANKTVSSCFAFLSSLRGVFVLLTYGTDYYFDQVITIGIGYFLYDISAMIQVYQSNHHSKRIGKDTTFKSFVHYQPPPLNLEHRSSPLNLTSKFDQEKWRIQKNISNVLSAMKHF